MALLWILLGVTLAVATIVSYYWIRFGAPWYVLSTGLFGILFFLFAVVWAIIAMSSGQPITATLGLVTFGMPGILLVAAGWRLLATKE